MTASPPEIEEQPEPTRPAVFIDEAGRQWTLRFNVNSMRDVRERTGFDLAGMFTAEGILQLSEDIYLMAKVLWVLCEAQATNRNVTETDFGDALTGDSLESAQQALVQAGLNFLPQARRTTIAQLWRRMESVGMEVNQRVREEIKKIDASAVLPSSGST